MQNIQIKEGYRKEIDGLRALAVIAVIINHLNKDFLPSGYLGVDIFFVISGYVITSSLKKTKSKNVKEFLISFYSRRIKRLFPALIIFIILTSLIVCFFISTPDAYLSTAKRSLLGLSNITLYRGSWDYFAEAIELNPFAHTWSLGVEEQFYFLYPILIWVTGFGRKTKNGERNLSFLILFLTVCSLVSFIFFYSYDKSAAYYLMPFRFWEMAVGGLIFLNYSKNYFSANIYNYFFSNYWNLFFANGMGIDSYFINSLFICFTYPFFES